MKFHRGRLMRKMNVRSVAELMRITMGEISESARRALRRPDQDLSLNTQNCLNR